MNLEDLAKQLANRVNQLHYVKWTLDKVAKNAYKKGFEDGQEQVKKLNINDVSNQREFLLTFAQEWNWANDIADSPVIPDGFVDVFLNQIKDENTTNRRRD